MMDGKTVTNPDPSITMYELCTVFHKLPDEIDRQSAHEMDLLLAVHNAKNKAESAKEKKQNNKQGRQAVKDKYK